MLHESRHYLKLIHMDTESPLKHTQENALKISVAEIERSAHRIKRYIIKTPILESLRLND